MKKLFIGCGIVVLLIVAVLGYITYQVYPQVTEWQSRWEAAFAQLQALEREHPFDAQSELAAPLNARRFTTSLELRATLADGLMHVGEQFKTIAGETSEGESLGVVELIREMFRTATPLLPDFQARLAEQQMSWPEFAFYTRLLWACLYRVDAGVGPPELESLNGAYGELSKNYETLRDENRGSKNLPPLADLIGKFPPSLVDAACELLARDLPLVERGLQVTAVDHFYMQPIARLEDLQGLQAAQQDIARHGGERLAGEGAGDAAPAGAPVPLGKVPVEELEPAPTPGQSGKPGDK